MTSLSTSPQTATTSAAAPARRTSSRSSTSLGLLIARLAIAVVMIAHGAQKVFTFTLDGTAASFADMGVPAASVTGPALAIFELVGGVLLLVGVGTRVVAALNAAAMIGALVIVHLAAGFFASDGGYELVLVLAAVSIALVLTGPGAYSVDALIARRRSRR
jgi:putative oxidoreductase